MSDTATPTPEQTMDAELAALAKTINPETPPAAISPAETPVSAASLTETPTVIPPATPPAADELSDFDKKLAAITDETVPAKPTAPALTDEQQQVLAIVPSVAALSSLNEQSRQLAAINAVLTNRDFAAFEAMLAPDALEEFEQYLYQKHVTSEKWIERWLKDKEGNPAVNSTLTAQQRQIQTLQARLDQQEAQKSTEAQRRAQKAVETQYRTHVASLFDKIEFSAADRRWVAADVDQRVGRDPNLLAAINSGNIAAINATFKAAVKEYVDRDKAAQAGREQAVAEIAKHKPIVQGAQVVQSGLLPDDINQVPKGQEEAWMDQQLAALKARHKR